MDTAQWAQGSKPMEDSKPPMLERKARPHKDQALNCPRCNSTNTKFCYYNNYSLSQPRYFCKTCRRYWTDGGSMRNVPVGGGSRKNKRPIPSSSSTSSPAPSSTKLFPDLTTPNFPQSASQNPKIHQGQDLNLAYPPVEEYNSIYKFIEFPYNTEDKSHTHHHPQNPSFSSTSSQLSAMQLLKTGITSSRGLNSFMTTSVSDSSTMSMSNSNGFPLQELKPGLNFSLEGFENGYGGLQGIQDGTGARILFPVEDLKQQQVASTAEFDQNRFNRSQGNSTGYWNGMLGGGSW